MSGILGVFPGDGAPVDDALMRRMLGRMSTRGSAYSGVWRGSGAALAAARHPWERAAGFSGDVLVVRDGDLALVADASLYYRADLRTKLAAANAPPRGDTPSHLMLAAYRAWGEQCVRHLEGDYAFILWDPRAHRVFCARDFAGSRPLFYAEVGGALCVASTLSALRAHPDCPADFNESFLAESAAQQWLAADETAYAALTAIPAGFSLSWTGRGAARLSQHWHPPAISSRRAPPLREAAAELRERLGRAVEERLAPRDVTSVWMSGGRDSTAVFASGQRDGRQLRPVSVSYPPGDSGREDETIAAVAQYWHAPIHWLDIREIPFFDQPAERAVTRDEPYEPPFSMFNRALARGSRSVGARVALDGWGGDQLFEMTPINLADQFRTGRWLALAREWRALQVRDFRYFFRTAIAPTLPRLALPLAALLRGGRPLPDPDERPTPAWMSRRWVKTVTERQRLRLPSRGSSSFANHELYVCLTSPTMARIRGWLAAVALEEGVEVRSPLYDERIIELAVRRPARERRSGRDTKLLLRAAMRDLLPEHVLAPRTIRTGVTNDYLRSSMRTTYPQLLANMSEPWILADLGIIEPGILRRSAEACLSESWSEEVAAALFFTLQTELWLRARVRYCEPAVEPTSEVGVLAGNA